MLFNTKKVKSISSVGSCAKRGSVMIAPEPYPIEATSLYHEPVLASSMTHKVRVTKSALAWSLSLNMIISVSL